MSVIIKKIGQGGKIEIDGNEMSKFSEILFPLKSDFLTLFFHATYYNDEKGLINKRLPHAWDQKADFLEDTSYYCIDKRLKQTCKPESLDSNFIKNWQTNKKEMCSPDNLTEDAKNFTTNTKIFEYKCLEYKNGKYIMDSEKCGCLDAWFTSSWEWYDANDKKYRTEFDITNSQFRDPWYWSRGETFNFGEFLDPQTYFEKQQTFYKLNLKLCKAKFKIDDEWERYEPRKDPFNAELAKMSLLDEYRKMIENTTQIRTVSNFAEMMAGQNVYAKECNSNYSVLAVIPAEDNEPRIAGITKCYFIMAAVASFSLVFAVLLYLWDGKAVRLEEQKNRSNSEKQEEPKKQQNWNEILKSFKVSALLIIKNDKVIALYFLCICFYVGVFTFVSQASTFFNEYHGIQAVVAGSITGAIYSLAVPLNFACGALVSSVGYQQGFLALAFVLSCLAHFIMMSIKSSVAAYAGVTLLALGYSFVGSTMWPLAGELLPDKYNGQVYRRLQFF